MNPWLQRLKEIKNNTGSILHGPSKLPETGISVSESSHPSSALHSNTDAEALLMDVHGQPESRALKDWRKLSRLSIKLYFEALGNRNNDRAKKSFTDACYASVCIRYLSSKDLNTQSRWAYLAKNIRYP